MKFPPQEGYVCNIMKKIRLTSAAAYVLLFAVAAGEAFAAESTHINSIGMEFILIPAGSFVMGVENNAAAASTDEAPQHRVFISRPFYLGKFEVTQAQWIAVMGDNPSSYKGRKNPVERVSWDDAQEFIWRLNAKEGHARYRLPTEAEWEYAARAGTESVYSFGDDARVLRRYAWYGEHAAFGSTHMVGKKRPNAWGLYDMHGNVREWVGDWYGAAYYGKSPEKDPEGPSSGVGRVIRGGCWNGDAAGCRSTARHHGSVDERSVTTGFRLAFFSE